MENFYPNTTAVLGLKSNPFSIVLLSYLYASFWQLPFINLPILTWYILFVLAFLAYASQNRKINIYGIQVFVIVTVLSLLGSTVSLIRAPKIDEAAYNTIGYAFNVFAFILLIPSLMGSKVRGVLLILHLIIAFLWTVEIQLLVIKYGVLQYSTFGETGSNKNFVGFCLALASSVTFYLGLFIKQEQNVTAFSLRIVKIFFIFISIYFLFNLSLIFARSSLLSGVVGILFVVLLFLFKQKNKRSALSIIIFFSIAISLALIIIIPNIKTIAPSWGEMALELSSRGVNETFDDRERLIQKGFKIISIDPILGLGIGGGRYPFEGYPVGLMHNSYLAEWVDRGILGIVSLLVWIYIFMKFLKHDFDRLENLDKAWCVFLFTFFIAMIFKDLGTLNLTMLAIFTGLKAELYLIDKYKKNTLIDN